MRWLTIVFVHSLRLSGHAKHASLHRPRSGDLRLAKTLHVRRINDFEAIPALRALRYDHLMFGRLRHLLGWVVSAFRSQGELLLENLALRQQLLALHAKRPRPRLSSVDRLFWVVLREVWSGGQRSLILVTPETVVRWHRTGFRQYWRCWRTKAPVPPRPIPHRRYQSVFDLGEAHGGREDMGSTHYARWSASSGSNRFSLCIARCCANPMAMAAWKLATLGSWQRSDETSFSPAPNSHASDIIADEIISMPKPTSGISMKELIE